MFRLCLATLLFILALTPAVAGHSPPKIFLAIYVQTTGNGLPGSQASPVKVPPDGETILVRTIPEVTERNLIDVQQDASGFVHFRFDHDGQVDLDAVTGQNQGRILVVTLNGIIVYAPLIDEQISNGELVMPHHVDPVVLKLLQEVAQQNVKEANRR
ncbi:MAG: hypothetical protein LV481_15050 [Methylacidiphilales bacterium]|nr:hypothetical protein [Candidatus Methylacidiphilales bacterium]